MTREKEINIAASRYIEENTINGHITISDHKDSFIKGAEWADSNAKLPWISVKDDLPCNHEELIIDTPLYKRTKSVVCNKPCGIRVDQMVYDMELNGWYWTGETPTHWFPAPEVPKE